MLEFTNSDAGSLTWQEAGKLVADGKAAFNIMGDWQDGYFSGTKAGGNLALKPGPATAGRRCRHGQRLRLAVRQLHAAEGCAAPRGGREVADVPRHEARPGHVQPGEGLDPGRKDANTRLYGLYLKTALKDWKSDALAGSLAHGVVASNAWNADIDTALGLFLQSKSVARFQTALVAAAKKNAK